MAILHLLNIADLFFMAAGVGVALLMIAMGGNDERRKTDRDSTPEPSPAARTRRR
jgi:hypothetical protein